jgi:hypothetical protein
MGTRSRIGVMHGDVVKSVYCHWDGYLEHNGQILLEHYDSAKANNLVALGDLSSLGTVIGEKHPFSQFDVPEAERVNYDNWCKFYGRDRGETGTGWKVAHTFNEFFDQCEGCAAEYYYIMKDGVWYTGTTYSSGALAGKLIPLDQALAAEAVEA